MNEHPYRGVNICIGKIAVPLSMLNMIPMMLEEGNLGNVKRAARHRQDDVHREKHSVQNREHIRRQGAQGKFIVLGSRVRPAHRAIGKKTVRPDCFIYRESATFVGETERKGGTQEEVCPTQMTLLK